MTATRSRPVGLLTIAVFVAVNALTIDRDPPVWQDEVQDVEPSVNLLLSARLTSSANAYADHLIVPHAWPYFAAQAGWLKAFGISPYSARWFHAVVVGLSVFVFAGAVRRLRVLRHESSVHALTARSSSALR